MTPGVVSTCISVWGVQRAVEQTGAIAELCKPEIEHLGVPIAANHHVLGLQVAMDDAGGMRGRQRAADLNRDVERDGLVHAARGEPFTQRSPSTYSVAMKCTSPT